MNNVRVRFLTGDEAELPANTTIYAETYEDAHEARSDDGSIRAVSDLVRAGTLAAPDAYCAGRCLNTDDYLVETIDGLAEPVEILPYEDAMVGAWLTRQSRRTRQKKPPRRSL